MFCLETHQHLVQNKLFEDGNVFLNMTDLIFFSVFQAAATWPRRSGCRRSMAKLCCCSLRTIWWPAWTSNLDQHSRSALTSTHWKTNERLKQTTNQAMEEVKCEEKGEFLWKADTKDDRTKSQKEIHGNLWDYKSRCGLREQKKSPEEIQSVLGL